MEVDEDDDFYAPEEPIAPRPVENPTNATAGPAPVKTEELEEGEEEDEGLEVDDDDEDDSDIDIITERKDGTKPAPPQQSRYSDIRNIPQRSTTSDVVAKPAAVKKEEKASAPLPVPTADQAAAAASSSNIDINANPMYNPAGKPIMQVNIDEDLPDNDKPWRKPGTDLSDYFNYGFDEFTWALYAAKQDNLRSEFNADTIAANNKKMMEDFNNMLMMGGMGMPGAGGAAGGGMPAIPGMEGITPEMQQMMQHMMASGMDPSQMDPTSMAAMFSGMQNTSGNAGGQGGNFGQGYGGQGQDYGYNQGMGGGGGANARGGFGGRGRGRRNQW